MEKFDVEQEKTTSDMATALGSGAVLVGTALSTLNCVRAESLHGAEGPAALVVLGAVGLAANFFGNKLPADPDAAKLPKQIRKNHKNGAYF
jgi:hypothetical protein